MVGIITLIILNQRNQPTTPPDISQIGKVNSDASQNQFENLQYLRMQPTINMSNVKYEAMESTYFHTGMFIIMPPFFS
ncbi:hypothetical protein Ctaglu_30390 [Clostridium tagluense]|uniref:Uncharacterized protein n=1 Tax=Clostridium tagluense TaxID=360422 RepID=A0A401UPG4_9CLOT|nr:hypothetical protein Ctaglu_30390 [Clostridium tagluense]